MELLAVIISLGVLSGILLAYVHKRLTSGKQNSSPKKHTKTTYSETKKGRSETVPEHWDGEYLVVCSNCGTYNYTYSDYCRTCTSGVYDELPLIGMT